MSSDTQSDTKMDTQTLAQQIKSTNSFGAVRVEGDVVHAQAWGAAEPAAYRVYTNTDPVIVELATDNRWLSESIEAELVESGDKLDELITDELVDLGYDLVDEGREVRFEHYRSDDMEFVFRSKVVIDNGRDPMDAALLWIRAYEACFRQLGDMDESEDD